MRFIASSLLLPMFVSVSLADELAIKLVSVNSQAQSAFQASKFSEAGELFVRQAQLHEGDEHKAWFNAGASFWNAGQRKEAFQYYEKAVAVNPLYFLGHKRLAIRHEKAEHRREAEIHRDHALAIRKVEKAMKPLWEKAHAIRSQGGDWHNATAVVHAKSAEAYEKLGYPEFAKAERQLSEKSRAELAAEMAKVQQREQQVQREAQERAGTGKLLSALADVERNAPASRDSLQGYGLLSQAFSGYSQIASAYDRQLTEQRESIHQQGQQTQAALLDPKQTKLQGDAKQRARALQQRLEEAEQEASAYLVEKGLLDESNAGDLDLDSLDL